MLKTREANKADLVRILELERRFETDLFFRSEIKDIEKCIDSGCSLVQYDPANDKVYAYVLVCYTEYGTAYLEKVFVHPEKRGKGFQRKLVADALLMIGNRSEPSYDNIHLKVCCTMVHPDNAISLSNFKQCRFVEKWRMKYKEQERIVLAYEADSK